MKYDDAALMPQKDNKEVNQRLTPNGNPESHFRQQIRDLLDLDWSTRDWKIYDELRRLKDIEFRYNGLLK